MLPTDILAATKKEIPFYFLSSYVDNLKSEGDFSLAGTEESILKSSIDFYASQGNPNIVLPVVVPETTESLFEIDFPDEFSSVVQIKDANLQLVPYEIDTVDSKISLSSGYTTPYQLRYRYKLEDYFEYHVDVDGNVVVDTDTDITQVEVAILIKRLLKVKLTEYNNKISEVSRSMQMELPVPENQGERALAEDAIRFSVRIQPSLMSV